jgi:hypothetical protein
VWDDWRQRRTTRLSERFFQQSTFDTNQPRTAMGDGSIGFEFELVRGVIPLSFALLFAG